MRRLWETRLVLTLITVAIVGQNAIAQDQPVAAEPADRELQLSIRSVAKKNADLRQFEVAIENVSARDTVLNLGSMLGNGKILLPDAIRLILTDPAGKSRELHFFDRRHPGVAGRVDDYVVPLRAGSIYTLKLDIRDFWCPETNEFDIKLEPRTYRIHAEWTGVAARHLNSDTQGLKATRFWQGQLKSDVVRFTPAGQQAPRQ